MNISLTPACWVLPDLATTFLTECWTGVVKSENLVINKIDPSYDENDRFRQTMCLSTHA
ncbi:MAG: hypothetical protein KDA65_06275 [Planctomycetaceae bacterium]|nr:hypothetical protein [Planctomycetaceae bacterium]